MKEKIAQVVFPLPAAKSFSYMIPEPLRKRVQRGSRVWAPLGKRLLTGFVIDLQQESELSELKPISDVLDPYPAFDPQMLQLTRWTAEYYMCNWGEVLNSALPSTVHFRGSEYLTLKDPKSKQRLSKSMPEGKQQALLELLRQKGAVSLSSAEKSLGRESLYAAIHELEQMGYAAVKAREERVVRLTESDPVILKQHVDALSKKAPRQALLLEILSANGGRMSALRMKREGGVSADVLKSLAKKGLIEVCFEEPEELLNNEEGPRTAKESILSPTQMEAFRQIEQALDEGRYQTILLQNSPGADRTPLYLRAISTVLRRGKSVIVMVPEIFLTTSLFGHLQTALGHQAAVLHSRLSDTERYRLWRQLKEGKKRLAIGPRSAVFAPVPDLGLIVVDEEQDPSYKCESNPRYNARDVAIMRGEMARAVVLLGSAAPSLESYHNASTGKFSLCRLPREQNSSLPEVTIVDIRSLRSAKAKKCAILSPLLHEKLEACLQDGKQVILFQNRRGYASCLQCSQCGFVPLCRNCQVSLSYHEGERQMVCHYCGFRQEAPTTCPQCRGHDVRFAGIGTEQVEKAVGSAFPQAKVLRLDLDTTKREDSYRQLVQFSQSGTADILLGTQMIAKGIDFPRVGLLAVVLADSCLNLPDFRAAEKTFHLLTQLTSRLIKGEIVIQTYSSGSWVTRYFKNRDFDSFAQRELADRKQLSYPPWGRIISLVFQGEIDEDVASLAEEYGRLLRELAPQRIQILGPSEAYLGKVKGAFRWQILLKGKSAKTLRELTLQCSHRLKGKKGVKITADVDPVDML